MKNSILFSSVTLTSALLIAACGDETTTAGIGGSGYVSSGTITGFGSIYVNGVKFETLGSTFDVDDNTSLNENDLAIGMRVVVKGSLNPDGVTGTASSVKYDEALQGPVTDLTTVDSTNLTFTTLGKTVHVSSTGTSFDGTSFGFGTIENKNNVEISGYFDSAVDLIATRIELKEKAFDPTTSKVEVTGTVTNIVGTSFNLIEFPNVTIDTSTTLIFDGLSAPSNGTLVEIEGKCTDISCTDIIAERVDRESNELEDASQVEIEGIITRYADINDFEVNGILVDASTAQREPTTLVPSQDMLVEVEGLIVGDVLIASKIELEGGENKVAATATAANASTRTIELTPVTGQTIKVKIDTSTEIDDEKSGINNLDDLLIDLEATTNNFIRIEGYDDGSDTNTLIAKSLKREKEADDVILQGIVTAGTGTSTTITVLGIDFPVSVGTEYFDSDEITQLSQVEFFDTSNTQLGVSLIKIKDDLSDGLGTANKVELESD